ncbi:hypothetical protein MMG00_00245 [Ignatzschineria rhizosphaerae]|uniref:Uncharacterized protein n=1 Tax=Ignatzschineria rhizosphaerae TaxID=2923279 RepID=A0ABY3X0E5_9GAMM|nr:hypothetical protein [Ignatzschineria rhizosphaerae]UNM96353.1 hypothetical protein MMG00_00245 [Ignatzschineria rhizosphaerae]
MSIEDFQSRDGFVVLKEAEFNNMMAFFKDYPENFAELLPIMTDNNSNYLCVYFTGYHRFQVAYLSHDEMDLTPIYPNISSLIQVINQYSECYDIEDIFKVQKAKN